MREMGQATQATVNTSCFIDMSGFQIVIGIADAKREKPADRFSSGNEVFGKNRLIRLNDIVEYAGQISERCKVMPETKNLKIQHNESCSLSFLISHL